MHQQYAFRGIKRYLIHRQLVFQLKDKLKKTLLQINADVIVCAKLDFVGVLNEVGGSVPLVVESHTLCKADYYEESGFLRSLHVWEYKRQVKKADAVVALTAGDARDWGKYNMQVSVIPNVVHINESEIHSEGTEKRIVFVGRYTKQKDFDSLLRIWSIIFSRHSDWTLDIYTDGEVQDPGVCVFKPVANMMEHYCNSSVLLLTSLFEPFGLVLPEAMSCGLPVVSFDCPYGPADIITDGVDGFLIKNRDVLAFADRVCQLIEDKELRVRMGQAAIKSSQRYRADVIMPKWKELFESLCRKE
jgi:glycosyltransferase involved in cell wall biosynthesis